MIRKYMSIVAMSCCLPFTVSALWDGGSEISDGAVSHEIVMKTCNEQSFVYNWCYKSWGTLHRESRWECTVLAKYLKDVECASEITTEQTLEQEKLKSINNALERINRRIEQCGCGTRTERNSGYYFSDKIANQQTKNECDQLHEKQASLRSNHEYIMKVRNASGVFQQFPDFDSDDDKEKYKTDRENFDGAVNQLLLRIRGDWRQLDSAETNNKRQIAEIQYIQQAFERARQLGVERAKKDHQFELATFKKYE